MVLLLAIAIMIAFVVGWSKMPAIMNYWIKGEVEDGED